ncbi:hypothetical protein HY838_00345 [Candidatus Azambacteria bacterium]|nr:hypothetical protein [Candidatus Azambacteria bacterium]
MITIPSPPSGTFGSFKAPERPKRSFLLYLIIASLIILIAAAGYFFIYRGVSLSLQPPILSSAPPLNSLEVRVSRLPDLQFGILDSAFYKSLKMYGALPVVADSLGRTNPFIPY